ncbi:MAG: hypothetical protein PHH40_02080 [Candidatus Moranbacteria bacterium]|nr:hypothetical protein [Candidatus Moranbacteria bacterium]MDD3964992.1 hypothetical protein [Candidatus Moranbacteria bacterium]
MIKYFLFFLSFFIGPVWAQGIEDGVAVTFFPVSIKAEKLVAVELLTSAQYADRYRTLEQSVMANDWRPVISFEGSPYNPGKCTVKVLPLGFDIWCWLSPSEKNPRVRESRGVVKTIPDVLNFISTFSKKREA